MRSRKEPDLKRPYFVKNHRFVGGMAVLLSSLMLLLYMPGMPSGLMIPEWTIIGIWSLLGVIFYVYAKRKIP